MFISFEGIEGSGKSTNMRLLAQHLSSTFDVVCTREPGGSHLGKTLRALLLDQDTQICDQTELFLFLADRAQHVTEVIQPALAQGKIVLCDRYIDSTLAYQGYARGGDLEQLHLLNTIASHNLMPDLTFVFDLPVEQALERVALRASLDGQNSKERRFDDLSRAFHERVRAGFLALVQANPQRCVLIESDVPKEVVQERCLAVLTPLLRALS